MVMAPNSFRVFLAEKSLGKVQITHRSDGASDGGALHQICVEKGANLAQVTPACCLKVALANFSLLQTDEPNRRLVLDRTELTGPFILFSYQADKAGAECCLSVAAKDLLLGGFMDERITPRLPQSNVGRGALAKIRRPISRTS